LVYLGLLQPGEDPFLGGVEDALRSAVDSLFPSVLADQVFDELLGTVQLRPAGGWA
jgi:hypothetical protein